ncbi:hypothetical protein EON62_06585, partial [archaeon]
MATRLPAVGSSVPLLLTDWYRHRVLLVARNGSLYTAAGCGVAGFAGDGGDARTAQLQYPTALAAAVSDEGDAVRLPVARFWIVDTNNHVVRFVGRNGIILTAVGNASAGNGFAGDGGPATSALLQSPSSVAVWADKEVGAPELWVADAGNRVVRHVDAHGIIRTLFGAGRTSAGQPYDADGNVLLGSLSGLSVVRNATSERVRVYVADPTHHRVLLWTLDNNFTLIAGNRTSGGYSGDGGPAAQASLNYPGALFAWPNATTGADEVWICDTQNYRVRAVDSATRSIRTVIGTGAFGYYGHGTPATESTINYAGQLAVLHAAADDPRAPAFHM